MGQCVSTPNDSSDDQKYSIVQTSTSQPMGLPAFHDEEADKIICAYIHFGEQDKQLYDVYIPRDILWLISTYHLRSMIIESGTICTLQSGIKYHFDELILEKWSVLTVNDYDCNVNEGGML